MKHEAQDNKKSQKLDQICSTKHQKISATLFNTKILKK